MRHHIGVIRFKIELFFGKDENYPKIVMSILGFELGFIAGKMMTTLA